MPRELYLRHDSAEVCYAVGRVFNGPNLGLWGNFTTGALEVFQAANWADYAIPLAELGVTGWYETDMPQLFSGERAVMMMFYEQAGANPDVAVDDDITVGILEMMDEWIPSLALGLLLL